MLHNIGLHIFSTTFDKLLFTTAATGVENQWSIAELENPGTVTQINVVSVRQHGLKGTGKAIFTSGCLHNLTKIHPLTSPITFGKDVELLPHAKVSFDTISRHVEAEYSIPTAVQKCPFFQRVSS